MESQISILSAQSGPIRRWLVAFSTRTVADDDMAVSFTAPGSPRRTREKDRRRRRQTKKRRHLWEEGERLSLSFSEKNIPWDYPFVDHPQEYRPRAGQKIFRRKNPYGAQRLSLSLCLLSAVFFFSIYITPLQSISGNFPDSQIWLCFFVLKPGKEPSLPSLFFNQKKKKTGERASSQCTLVILE